MNENQKIGITIRRIRKQRGLTMRQLATQAKLTTSTVCHTENASKKGVQMYTLIGIAKALDITVSDLLKKAGL